MCYQQEGLLLQELLLQDLQLPLLLLQLSANVLLTNQQPGQPDTQPIRAAQAGAKQPVTSEQEGGEEWKKTRKKEER